MRGLRIYTGKLLLLLACTCLAQPASAQQGHYEFVPGSRQARWVPGPAQTQTYSQTRSMPGRDLRIQNIQTRENYSSRLPDNTSRAVRNAGRSFEYSDSFECGGLTRSYLVHLPPGYDPRKPLPVVLAFHGLGMNATMMYGLTGFTGLADRKNFIVVFPNAAGGRFQDGMSSRVDDISFVAAMLDRLAAKVAVDRRRVYACGISNGGYFTQLLALAMPERIAACGVVAATLNAGAASAGGAAGGGKSIPVVFFWGSEDPLIPWDDGRRRDLGKLGEALGISQLGTLDGPIAKMGGLYSAPETLDFWIAHNHAGTSATSRQMPDSSPGDGTRVERLDYGGGRGQVLLYRVNGGGHTWPGALNLKAVSGISGNISQDIDASALLWEFFSLHSL